MFKQIFKIIWKERRMNAWALIELSIGFVILWLCVDYLYFVIQRVAEPMGRDYEHAYYVQLGVKKEAFEIYNSDDEAQKEETLETVWTIFDRIKNHPAIESVCITQRKRGMDYYKSDSAQEAVFSILHVTPEYFDLFHLDFLKGRPFVEEDGVGTQNVIISGEYTNLFAKQEVTTIDKITFFESFTDEKTEYNVVGVVNPIKRFAYERYVQAVFYPLSRNDQSLIVSQNFYVRVKPEADINFAQTFKDDMTEQLSIGPYYYLGVTDMIENVKSNMENYRQYDETKNIYAISGFLLVNVFLGIMGTFWLRVQSRRGNIGLRRAVGASEWSIQSMLLNEGLYILLIASIIGIIICVNIVVLDLIRTLGIPTSRNIYGSGISEEIETLQFFINYGITFLVLAIMTGISIWYPAKKASDIPPVEALRSE